MIFSEETHNLKGKTVVLRNAGTEDADELIRFLRTVTGETAFLACEPDEIGLTTESEIEFINRNNASEGDLIMVATVDGEHAGNCSFHMVEGTRRYKHRVMLGIALYDKFTGFGLGRLMMERLLETVRDRGFEQAELIVTEGNERAYNLYKSMGFAETGRTPRANKYDNGTYADNIHMVKFL